MAFDSSTQISNTKPFSDAPPNYSEHDPNPSSTSALPNPTYEENEYGEMQPAGTSASRTRIPTSTVFQENEYGELHRAETDPDSLEKSTSSGAIAEFEDPESIPDHFGEDTAQKAKEYCSDEIYPENRFGELGRADTFVASEPHLSDKIKGTAEQLIGRLTGNKELHDKGLQHKARHHHHYSLGCEMTTSS